MGQGAQAMFVVVLILSIACILVFPPLALLAVIGIGLYVFLPDNCFEKIDTVAPVQAVRVGTAPPAPQIFRQAVPPPTFMGSLARFVHDKELEKELREAGTFNHEHEERRRTMFDEEVDRTVPVSVEAFRDGMDEFGKLMARRAEVTRPDPDDLIEDPEIARHRAEHQEVQATMQGFNNTRFAVDDAWV